MEEIGKSRESQILIKIIHLWSSDIQIKNQGAREIEARKKSAEFRKKWLSFPPVPISRTLSDKGPLPFICLISYITSARGVWSSTAARLSAQLTWALGAE